MTIDDTVNQILNRSLDKLADQNASEEVKKVFSEEFYKHVPVCIVSVQMDLLSPQELDFLQQNVKEKGNFQEAYFELVERFSNVKTRILTAEAAKQVSQKLEDFCSKIIEA